MVRKRSISFTLSPGDIQRLQSHANAHHRGNRSQALTALIRAVQVPLSEYGHKAPPAHRNYRGTGKCNPFLNGEPPCAVCWGENVRVELVDALVGKKMDRVLRVINLEDEDL